MRHKCLLKKGEHKNKKLQNSYNKHSADKFTFKPIIYCGINNLEYYEQLVIDAAECVAYGYNINPIAGRPPSP